MKSSLLNMVLVLFVITLMGSAAVGLVYRVTAEPIAKAKGDKKLTSLAKVLPEFDNRPADEMRTVEMDGKPMNVYTARKGGEVVGYAIESSSPGFAADIKIIVGFDAAGLIKNIEVLEQSETPGLGAKLADADNPVKASIAGRNAGDIKLSVRKDGGDVDAITASTISSRAYTAAVAKAYEVFKGLGGGQTVFGSDAAGGQAEDENVVDGTSGATTNGVDGTSGATTNAVDDTSGATTNTMDGTSGATQVNLNGEGGSGNE
jgi:electron transport complex protein RnfG